MSSSMADEDSRNDCDLHTIIDETFEVISSLWVEMYGANDSEKDTRLEIIKQKFVGLCQHILQIELKHKEELEARIKEAETKILQWKELLGLDNIPEINYTENTPLVQVDRYLQNIKSRLENLASLKE